MTIPRKTDPALPPLAWVRITVVVISAAFCTGKALIWMNL